MKYICEKKHQIDKLKTKYYDFTLLESGFPQFIGA